MGTEKLIKQKPEQQSEVWEFDDRFRKKWLYKDKQWLTDHYKMLERLCEDGYLKGFGFDENFKQFPCKCGAPNCCGYIIREESRWRIHKKFAMSKKKLVDNFR